METNFALWLEKHTVRFKSYYVVWKLEGYKAELWKEACLNRTM